MYFQHASDILCAQINVITYKVLHETLTAVGVVVCLQSCMNSAITNGTIMLYELQMRYRHFVTNGLGLYTMTN